MALLGTVTPSTEPPSVPASSIPAVRAVEMREIDRLAVEEFGITLPQMMELAGAHLADLVVQDLGGVAGRRIAVVVGPGNNGGGGLVAARHLVNRGAWVHVVLAEPVRRLRAEAGDRLATLIAMQVRCCVAIWDLRDAELDRLLEESDVVVDALLGYAAEGPLHGPVAEIVERLRDAGTPIVSLDLPTGIDPDTGITPSVAARSAATMTLALPKTGLLTASGREHAGRLYLADIGLPAALYRQAGLEFVSPFQSGPIVRLD